MIRLSHDFTLQIETWLIAPYKKPERDLRENEIFNNHVSMVRIRSEHAIGFLKGRFQSLKGLRVNITDEATHKLATYWVAACIGLHSFALMCEEEDRAADEDVMNDPFIQEGFSSDDDLDEGVPVIPHAGVRSLPVAKQRREQLKRMLFEDLEQRHRAGNVDTSSSESESSGTASDV